MRARGLPYIWLVLVGCALCGATVREAVAQPSTPPPAPGINTAAPSAEPAVVIPPASPRVRAYNRFWYAYYFVTTFWEFAGLWLFLRTGLSASIRTRVERRTRLFWLQTLLFFAAFSLFQVIWALPFSFGAYLFERSYGFATQSVGLWATDKLRGYALGFISAPGVYVGYLLIRRYPRRWWLILWLVAIPFSFCMTVIAPVLLDPVYNDFRPLKNAELSRKLVNLADRAGIHGAQVYEVDISKRTTKLNAYVTGLGPTKRIVLWDTTLRSMPEDEILAIVGHEMGHYALRHIWWNFLIGIVGSFILLWLFATLYPWTVSRWGKRAGVRDTVDLAALPLAMLLLGILLFLQTPVAAAISRYQEHQADEYGLRLTHLNVPMARAFVAFVRHDYADPDPPRFIVFWLYTHPPIRERVAFALAYR